MNKSPAGLVNNGLGLQVGKPLKYHQAPGVCARSLRGATHLPIPSQRTTARFLWNCATVDVSWARKNTFTGHSSWATYTAGEKESQKGSVAMYSRAPTRGAQDLELTTGTEGYFGPERGANPTPRSLGNYCPPTPKFTMNNLFGSTRVLMPSKRCRSSVPQIVSCELMQSEERCCAE